MLTSLQDLRKGLKSLIKMEQANEWSDAHHFYKWVFVPSMDLVGVRMGISRDEVRKLL